MLLSIYFDSDNISHQAIIIHQLNKLINNSDILLSLRRFIFKKFFCIKQSILKFSGRHQAKLFPKKN